MSDDLERTLTESLDRHARRLGSRPEGHLDAVWSRLDRRRNDRRRNVAAVGSVIVVGAGVTGIMLVGAADDGPAPGDGAPITTLTGIAWRCTGLFGDDGTFRYYSDCTPVAEVPPLTTGWTASPGLPTTVPVPMATAPPTTAIDPTFPPVATTAPIMTVPNTTTTVVTANGIEYEVQEGDSLFAIAAAYGVGAMEIAAANGWDDGVDHLLLPGDVIGIPLPSLPTAPPTTPSSSYVSVIPTWPVCEDLSGEAPVTVPCQDLATATAVPTDAFATTAPPVPAPANSFRCTGVLGTDGSFEYLQACETIGPDGAVEPAVPTTMPTTESTLLDTVPPSVVTNPEVPTTLPPATTAPPLSTSEQLYVLRAGDNPTKVANLFGITVEALRDANPEIIDTFIVGDVLTIPAGAVVVDPSELEGRTLVPSLVGLTEGQARERLTAAGLTAGEIAYVELPAGDPNDGVVIEHNPGAGTDVEPGISVDISIGSATAG